MELFNIGNSVSSAYVVVPLVITIGAVVPVSLVRGNHSRIAVILSLMLLCLLSLQWVLYDVALATELGTVIVESETSLSDVPRIGVLDAAPAPVPENIRVFHSLILAASHILFVIAIPVVLTGALLKRARLRESPVSCASVNLRTLRTYVFVASLRQLCASPDAHGP